MAELSTIDPVIAVLETEVFSGGETGDIADDPAIWVNPNDPALSVVVGTNKSNSGGGIAVYDLAGNERQYRSDGKLNNVDVRSGVTLGGVPRVVFAATDRTIAGVRFYRLNTSTRLLEPAGSTGLGFPVYGCSMYQEPDGTTYVIVSQEDGGALNTYRLNDNGSTISVTLVRELSTAQQVEGIACLDRTASMFVGVEDVGLYRYSANPNDGGSRVTIGTVGDGNLVADIEGLTVADYGDEAFLIASSQGNSTFQVYDATGSYAHRRGFSIAGNGAGVDGVTETDGLHCAAAYMGPDFPHGLLVVHDNSNSGANKSNYKYARLEDALRELGDPTPPPDPGETGDAPVFRSYSRTAVDDTDPFPIVVDKPAGLSNGDLLVAVLTHASPPASAGSFSTLPPGFTVAATQGNDANTLFVATKAVTDAGSEPATYSFGADLHNEAVLYLLAYTDVDGAAPIEDVVTDSATTTTEGLQFTVDAGGDNRRVICIATVDDNQTRGWTEDPETTVRVDDQGATSTWLNTMIADDAVPTGSHSYSFAYSGNISTALANGIALVLRPAAADTAPPPPSTGEVSFVGVEVDPSGIGSETTTSVPIPAGVAAGDRLICFVDSGSYTAGPPTSVPEGWALIADQDDGTNAFNARKFVYTKVAGTDDVAPTFTFATGTYLTTTLVAYRGVDPDPFIDSGATAFEWDNTTHPGPILQNAEDEDAWVVLQVGARGFATDGASFSIPGLTKRADVDPDGTSTGRMAVAVADSAGPLGTAADQSHDVTPSPDTSNGVIWAAILRPAPAPIDTADIVEVTPGADTWIEEANPTANHGTDGFLDSDANPRTESYVKFPLHEFDGRSLAAAELEFRVLNASEDEHTIHLVDPGTWTQDTLTWSNRPTVDPFVVGRIPPGTAEGDVVRVPLAASSIEPAFGQPISFAIVPGGGDGLQVASSESATPPILRLTLGARAPVGGGLTVWDGTQEVALEGVWDGATIVAVTAELAGHVPANQPPVADFVFTTSGLSVSANASASYDPDGTIATYEWRWGDGDRSTGETATHSYDATGSYSLRLTVTDAEGATTTVTKTVTVEATTGGDLVSVFHGWDPESWNLPPELPFETFPWHTNVGLFRAEDRAALTVHNGDYQTSGPGERVDRLHVRGEFIDRYGGAIVKRSWIEGRITNEGSVPSVFIHCDHGHGRAGDFKENGTKWRVHVYRGNMFGLTDGMMTQRSGNFVLQDTFIHDLRYAHDSTQGGDNTHNDALQVNSDNTEARMIHCTVWCWTMNNRTASETCTRDSGPHWNNDGDGPLTCTGYSGGNGSESNGLQNAGVMMGRAAGTSVGIFERNLFRGHAYVYINIAHDGTGHATDNLFAVDEQVSDRRGRVAGRPENFATWEGNRVYDTRELIPAPNQIP